MPSQTDATHLEDRSARPRGRRNGIACIAAAPWNPYLELLYRHLDAFGLVREPEPELSLGWLWSRRHTVRVLHFHWPEGLYRFERGPGALRPPLSWVKLGLLSLRLLWARLLGYRLTWTVHQVFPHQQESPRRDRAAARLLARMCHVLLAHDRVTAETAIAELRGARAKIHIVAHGSYIGVYPPGRARSSVRAELELAPDAFAFLSFGEIRKNKGIELLLDAWAEADLPGSALVIAGNPKDPEAGESVRRAASSDARIRPLLGFWPAEAVAELFDACDAALLTRTDGGTSGSLILALSLGLPVVLADMPAYRELTENRQPGWPFRPGDRASLRTALETAAADPADARARGRIALEIAEELRWEEIAERTAALMLDESDGNSSAGAGSQGAA